MAKLVGNPFGEMRGRVGGFIFSRNKGGQYVKVHVKQDNANTQAQKNTRNVFRSVAGAWSVLSAAMQQGWREFALTTFNPVKNTNKGNYTGVQAYRSLKAMEVASAAKMLPMGITTDITTPAITLTRCAPVCADTPPVSTVRPNIYNTANSAFPLKVTSAALSASGVGYVELAYDGIVAPFLVGTQLKDENAKKYGISIFLSNGVKTQFSAIKNAMQFNLGNSGIPTFTTPNLSGTQWIRFDFNSAALIANFKAFPWAGMSALMTVGVIGEDATFSLLGSIWVTLT